MIEKKANRPIYVQIKDIIEDMIRNKEYKPGEPILSEHEMANKLEVSRLTVRKAYSELVKDGILRAVQGKGTFISEDVDIKSLKESTQRRNTNNKVIGIVFPEITSFFPEILKGIEERATENGYSLNIMFNDSYEKEKIVIDNIIENSINGVILSPYRATKNYDSSHLQRLRNAQVPMVYLGKPPINVINNSVYCDDISGAYMGVEHLIKTGYKKIIYITDSNGDKVAYDERLKGYTEAMSMYSLSANTNVIDIQDENWEKQLVGNFQESSNYPAIFSFSDTLNFIIYKVLLSYRVDLTNIKLIACDNFNPNFPFAYSTIEQPKRLMGQLAFDLLLKEISKPNTSSNYAVQIPIKPKLVIR